MRISTVAVFFVALVCARTARAQDPQWPERIWISAGGGLQAGGSQFDDTLTLPLYAETERINVDYPVKDGPAIDARGGYRVWKRATVGLGVTHYSARDDARVRADLPHPFFDNQFRQVEGTVNALRGETAVHLLLGWMQPISNRLRVVLVAGPSFVNVEQTVVTGVQVSESYPYDTAQFSGAATRRATRGATGFNAGADLTWMFSRSLGAGALVQGTRARVRLDAGEGRTVSVDTGGVQAAIGIRLFF